MGGFFDKVGKQIEKAVRPVTGQVFSRKGAEQALGAEWGWLVDFRDALISTDSALAWSDLYNVLKGCPLSKEQLKALSTAAAKASE